VRPAPQSDWAYYWAAAGEASRYERGGLGLWLLAVPKAFGVSPLASALLLNLPAAAGMLWLTRAAEGGRWGLATLLVALYLLLLTPFAGMVQLDLIAATAIAAGFYLALVPPMRWPRALSQGAAWAMVVAGTSTKPQYGLVLWGLIGLFAIPWWWLRRRTHRWAPGLVAVLLLGSVSGIALDLGLRAASTRQDSIRTTSAVTLYSGLLTSSDGPGCGHWSPQATQAAIADLRRPLHEAVLERLAQKPAAHWRSVMHCKWLYITHPPAYALYWLVESPNIRAKIDADPRRASLESTYRRALFRENQAYGLVGAAIVLLVVGVCLALWLAGAPLPGLLPVLWVMAFWAVHLVFEIQGRYFLGMYLLAPLLCALAIRAAEPDAVDSRFQQRS